MIHFLINLTIASVRRYRTRENVSNKSKFMQNVLWWKHVILFIGYHYVKLRGLVSLFARNRYRLDNESSPVWNLICCNVNAFARGADWISETITRCRRWATWTVWTDASNVNCMFTGGDTRESPIRSIVIIHRQLNFAGLKPIILFVRVVQTRKK